MNVAKVMTKDVGTCSPDSDLESTAKLMWEKDCGSIPVIDASNKLIGIVTDRDIAMGCALNHKAEWELKTRDILNGQSLHTCRSDQDIRGALKLMSQYHVRRLPVVDSKGHLQGMLSIDDIIAVAQENSPELSYHDTMNTLKQVCIHH